MIGLASALIALQLALTGISTSLEQSATTTVPAVIQTPGAGGAVSVEAAIRAAFPDAPIMLRIARCESQYRQFDADGSVHRGKVNRHDTGLFQINETYHVAEARKLGMDIYTLSGNIRFARVLYDRNGTRDWNWSKGCWQNLSK